jgi:streptomycin 6-kinase
MFGDAVMKVGYSPLENEYNCLREFAGRGACEVFACDLAHHVILEQRITPGTTLLEVTNQDDRIDKFVSLFENLHVVPSADAAFPTIHEVMNRRLGYIRTREDCHFLSRVIDKAKNTLQSLCSKCTNQILLHGDLHHQNILLSQDQNYLIIDPIGYIGDPVFDVSRFIMLEFDDNLTSAPECEILEFISKVADRLHMASSLLIQCLFVDNVTWLSSDLQHGESLDDSQFIVDNIFVAERLLHSCAVSDSGLSK